ncbi:MAG: hypothetical protein AABY22_25625 [Nanoarchaeota archaeon]|mgnify:CR=1 FL=1
MDEKEEQQNNIDMKQRIKEMTTRNFTVTNCPETVFERFSHYARREAGDYYAMAIKQLLDTADANVKELVLFQEVQELKDRLHIVENKEDKKKHKTFGGGIE